MMENMQEIVKNLTLITRDLARGRESDRCRNQYGPKPYWNPQKKPMNDDIRKNPLNQAPPDLNAINQTREQEQEDHDYYPHEENEEEDSPQKINFTDDLDGTFGRILIDMEDDIQDDSPSMGCIPPSLKINEIKKPIVQIYKMEKGRERPLSFFDQKLEEKKNEDKELDIIPIESDLNINIEKELDKITQSIPLTELIKFPSVKDQVIEFFDSIPIVG